MYMKKLLLLIFLLPFACFAQTWQNAGGVQYSITGSDTLIRVTTGFPVNYIGVLSQGHVQNGFLALSATNNQTVLQLATFGGSNSVAVSSNGLTINKTIVATANNTTQSLLWVGGTISGGTGTVPVAINSPSTYTSLFGGAIAMPLTISNGLQINFPSSAPSPPYFFYFRNHSGTLNGEWFDATGDLTWGATPTDLGYTFGVNGSFGVAGAKSTFAASATGYASINLAPGVAPTAPVNGDLYETASHLFARIGGTTYQIDQQSAGGSFINNQTSLQAGASFNIGATGYFTSTNNQTTIGGVTSDINMTDQSGDAFNIHVDNNTDNTSLTTTGGGNMIIAANGALVEFAVPTTSGSFQYALNFIPQFTTTVTSGTTYTLTAGVSTEIQEFTGTTNQSVVLPLVSTLFNPGFTYIINNSSSATVTVKSSGGNTVQAMVAGSSMEVTFNGTVGTTAASWTIIYYTGNSGGITALTGDVTASGSGSVAATLATVNSGIGTFTNPVVTANGKGLITSISNGTGAATSTQITSEIPTGAVNGVNTVFTLANTPITGSAQVYYNGQLVLSPGAYTISTNTITFGTAPASGVISVTYLLASTTSAVTSISETVPTALFSASPTTWTVTSGAATATLALANQSAFSIFGNFTGSSATPTFSTNPIPYVLGGTNAATAWTQGSIFFAGASAFAQNNADLFWDNTNDRLGINTATPVVTLQTVTTATSAIRGVAFDQVSNDANGSKIYERKARGTPSSLAVIASGDPASHIWSFYDGTNYVDAAKILVTTVPTISTGIVPATMALQTANPSGTLYTAILADQNQQISFPGYGTNGALTINTGVIGVTAFTTAATSTTLMERDGNANVFANGFTPNLATTATAAGTTTLTVVSAQTQVFTGTTTQTVALPNVGTLATGMAYYIPNSSTGTVTVQSSGGNTVQAMAGGTSAIYFYNGTGGTGAASWTVFGYSTGGGFSNPMTTLNDIIIGGSSGTPTRLGIGATNAVLTYNGSNIVWSVPGTGGTVTTVSVVTANGISGTVANATTTPAITLTLGAIVPTSVNGLTFTANSTGFSIAGGTTSKTLTINNTLTFAGTDATTMTFPTTSATIARTDASNTFTGHQTIEGVTSTGATGTGNFVFSAGATFTGTTTTATLTAGANSITGGVINATRAVSGAATTNGLAVANSTTATSGTPIEYAPTFTLQGFGWNTSGTPASNSVIFQEQLQPTTGATVTGNTFWGYNINNAGNVNVLELSSSSGGALTILGGGTLNQAGSSSGTITFKTQSAAGTYNWNWPTTAGTVGQVLLSDGGGAGTGQTWGTASITQASADLTAQTSAGNVTTFTVGASTATFNISTYINVTAVSVDVIQGQVTYTDENNTSQTISLSSLSAIGNSAYNPVTIRAKNATVITVKTNLTTGAGSITFDTGARITQL